jgi:hypothetical protein
MGCIAPRQRDSSDGFVAGEQLTDGGKESVGDGDDGLAVPILDRGLASATISSSDRRS